MLYKEKTKIGTIKYDNQIIGNIAKKIASDMDNRIIFATSKGRPIKTTEKPSEDDFSFVDAQINGESMDIVLYIIIVFGTSINKIAEEFTAGFRDLVPTITGLKPNLININIKGVQSKNLSKRSIEVKSYADDSTK